MTEKGLAEDLLAPVVQKMDSAIHWITYYPKDRAILILWIVTYPLDSVIQLLNNRGLGPVSRKSR